MTKQTAKSNNLSNNNLQTTLFVLYSIITIAIYTLPATKFLLPYIPTAIVMLISLPLLMLIGEKYSYHATLSLIASVFLMLIIYIVGMTPIDSINEAVRNIRFFIPVMWGLYGLEFCDRKKCGWILFFTGAILSYILFNTLIALETDPWIARKLAQGVVSSSAELNSYRLNNIGGFEFSYMMGIITLCLVWTTLSTRRIWIKLIFVVLSILSFYFIIQTMYTTLLIITFVCTTILLIIKIKNPLIKFLVICSSLFILIFLSEILLFISNLFPRESLLSEKFYNIYYAMTNDDLSEMGSRPQLILNSLKNWLKSPIFGSISENSNSHSMMINILESTGIIGFLAWFSFLIYSYKLLIKQLKTEGLETKLFSVSFIFLLALSFFNPISYVFEITIATFFIVPIWQKCLPTKENCIEQ